MPGGGVGSLLVTLKLDNREFTKQLKITKKDMVEVDNKTKNLNKSMGSLKGAVKLAAAALAVLGVAKVTKSFFDAGLQANRMDKALSAATGSTTGAAKATKFLWDQSNKLGLSFEEQLSNYTRLAASGRELGFSSKEIERTWSGLAKAGTALQLSTEDMTGIFRAVDQMMNKGKIQAEELRGQLAERLPGAYAMTARAMGITTQELSKQLELGKVYSLT